MCGILSPCGVECVQTSIADPVPSVGQLEAPQLPNPIPALLTPTLSPPWGSSRPSTTQPHISIADPIPSVGQLEAS